MPWFVVEQRYVPEKYADVRPRHREYLSTLAEQGVVALAGPLDGDTGGMALYQATDREHLQNIIDADPYYVEGAVAERTVRDFKPVLGSWLPASSD
ncbi:YciI family protein [Saccharomonospora iraqiensis]|uniref:YciI family protein n=1 Tax=Saccharomonospora iraqiensis TaxID=52698 RepID=UPI00041E95A2|nr:YciI family protein [Saccharomonospora iraqiensis]